MAAEMIEFELITPDCGLASGEASEVRLPGGEGDLSAMAGHTPLVTGLRPGVITIANSNGNSDYAVSGGFAEITAGKVSMLADWALPLSEVQASEVEQMLEAAKAQASEAEGLERDRAEKFVADLTVLLSQLG